MESKTVFCNFHGLCIEVPRKPQYFIVHVCLNFHYLSFQENLKIQYCLLSNSIVIVYLSIEIWNSRISILNIFNNFHSFCIEVP